MLDAACLLRTRLRREDRGASLVEYTLLLALIALVCVGALMLVGGGTGAGLDRSSSCIRAAYANEPLPADCPR